jgi:hypothetical protein
MAAGAGAPSFQHLDVLVQRAEALIADYVQEARQSGVRLRATDIVDLIEDAARAAREPSEPEPEFAPTVEGAYLQGLYEELIQQPSSIYEQKTLESGSAVWATLDAPLWLEVLRRLKATLQRARAS